METGIDIQKYVEDPRLIDQLNRFMNIYLNRAVPLGSKSRYLRTAEDALIEKGLYEPHKFIEEFLLITAKKSKLSKSLRDCILRYVAQSLVNLHKEDNKTK